MTDSLGLHQLICDFFCHAAQNVVDNSMEKDSRVELFWKFAAIFPVYSGVNATNTVNFLSKRR